jgi:hypothetical protein
MFLELAGDKGAGKKSYDLMVTLSDLDNLVAELTDERIMYQTTLFTEEGLNQKLAKCEWIKMDLLREEIVSLAGITTDIAKVLPIKKHGIKAGGAISGEGNARFTQEIRNLNNDLRQGGLNIFLMRSKIETKSAQTALGREAGRVIEKKFGVNTQILYFEDEESLKAQLTKAINEYAVAPENKDKLPKIFVDCLMQDDLNTVNDFINVQKQADNTDIDKILAIGRDFTEGGTPKELPDEVKVILVGNVIMNDRRLRDDFNKSPEDLLEGRKRTISFLKNNGIIDEAAIADDQIDGFFNDLWKGIKMLRITKIDWKIFQDWKNSNDEVLRAL